VELESEPELELVSSPASASGLHVPDWQVPSEHGALSAFAGLEQSPVFASHVPTSWQSSEAEQTTGAPAAHTPAWQVSTWVQALPSSQGESSALAGLEQPVAASQAPVVWH
jgi:hypothetical protein